MKLLVAFISVILSTGCGTDKDDVRIVAPRQQIIVIFAPGGLGDRCYNDCILNGVTSFKKVHNDEVDMYIYAPSSLDDAERVFSDWLSLPGSNIPALTVLGSGDYMDMAGRLLPQKPLTPNKRVLLFESANAKGLPVTTFQISTFGASYLAGACVAESGLKPLVLLSNPNDLPIRAAGDGFKAGFGNISGNIADTEFLADDWHGYLMSGEAYRKMSDWAERYSFIFPMAGGSNAGLYRYSREYPDESPLLAGVDVDQSSLSNLMIGSVVKRIDLLLAECLEHWLSEGELPDSKVYGLESGYSGWLLAPGYVGIYNDIVENITPEAIKQEKAYFEGTDL